MSFAKQLAVNLASPLQVQSRSSFPGLSVDAYRRYYGECFCSKSFKGDNGIEKTADCNTPCRGDASQMCGGPSRVTAWGYGDARGPAPEPEPVTTTTSTSTSSTTASTATSTSTGRMGWKYMGCFSDQVGGVRTFGQGLIDLVPGGAANMTNANCQAACLQRGFKYCGTEYVLLHDDRVHD